MGQSLKRILNFKKTGVSRNQSFKIFALHPHLEDLKWPFWPKVTFQNSHEYRVLEGGGQL